MEITCYNFLLFKFLIGRATFFLLVHKNNEADTNYEECRCLLSCGSGFFMGKQYKVEGLTEFMKGVDLRKKIGISGTPR